MKISRNSGGGQSGIGTGENMNSTKMYQIMRIARKYYDFNIGQLEIAQEEGISKSTVSRLLKKAHELGYVKVIFDYALDNIEDIANQLKEIFDLKEVYIVPRIVDDDQITLQDTCRALASRLDKYLSDDCVVGVSWGRTMNCLAQNIKSLKARNIRVVQLNGSVSKHTNPTGATRIVDALSKNGKGEGYLFPVPAIVDSKEISDVLKKDSQVSRVLGLAQEATVTIFSIGALSKKSILYEVGYFGDEEYDQMVELGAVGDVATHFFRVDGKIANPYMDERVVGLNLDDFKKKDYNIAIAIGQEKVKPIIGALVGGYTNVLYTDEETARAILQFYMDEDIYQERQKEI